MKSYIKKNPSTWKICIGFTIIIIWIAIVIPVVYLLPSAISFLIVPLSFIPFIPMIIKWYLWVTASKEEMVDRIETPVVSPLQTGTPRVML